MLNTGNDHTALEMSLAAWMPIVEHHVMEGWLMKKCFLLLQPLILAAQLHVKVKC